MLESEAIKELHSIRQRGGIIPQKRAEAIDAAIKALEEVQKYRAIDTPEECRAAVEKQIAKKPKEIFSMIGTDKGGICPCCDKPINNVRNCHYCDCGQRLEW